MCCTNKVNPVDQIAYSDKSTDASNDTNTVTQWLEVSSHCILAVAKKRDLIILPEFHRKH